jgi:hypothetical protein
MNTRPVVVYQTSSIRELWKNNNPMVGVVSNWIKTVSTKKALIDAVGWALAKADNDPALGKFAPPVADVIEVGRYIAYKLKGDGRPGYFPVFDVLEPNRALEKACTLVVQLVIQFSQTGSFVERNQIMLDGFEALNEFAEDREMQAALKIPLPC